MFSKILVANRGEIAVRIIRACKEMGISTVAIYSMADAEALHVSLADECICVGRATPAESYLNQKNIISAALVTGAQAIHPGYGFLSENADFAKLCRENGIVFIGPDAETIARMGDKDAARRLMKEAGVPTVPGSDIITDEKMLKSEAARIGYPLLIKARSGGGGKGIRLVEGEDELLNAYRTASGEALAAFGDGGVYMEKFLSPTKHIEVQLLADEKGHVIALGERECSIQLNNQKLVEESPSPAVTPELRKSMMDAAVKAAKAAKYTNAGTIEFLLDRDRNFYFMEMNTRLQVEHPVSEYTTGVDIVKWQIRIAAGVELAFRQKDIIIGGAAIECRINAKSAGTLGFMHVPGGPWVRFDTALYSGYNVPVFYDSMVGKLIVFAKTREEAIRKMHSALCELVLENIPNNIDEQLAILNDSDFKAGDYYTNFMTTRGW
ncbi:MAG: acetyl-CoA carboxylase biotin carboxylase subunit [Synergistes sp.]|nr:acetyl-CoA carboxylase biotin carboxylase subunit [Clostridia bacterium]MBQ9882536.1 acetyl-CoA carboxylase biotin carboxylase subunit [Synergistes sp.]